MLEFLRGIASDRQLRLFACACCRGVWGFVPVGPCREAVEVAIRFADGRATADELAAARAAAVRAAESAGSHSAAAWAASESANPSAFGAARAAAHEAQEQIRRSSPRAAADEARAQAVFLRDIIGDPFRAGRVRRFLGAARNPLVREIAEAVYPDPRHEDLKYLAEELDRLGCPDDSVLTHCRSTEPHVRGCWVVDLILGTEPEPQPTELVARERPPRAEEIRQAFAQHLSPKKYRRCLRKAIAAAPGPGRIGRPAEWEDFVRAHPEYDVPDDQLTGILAVCPVHGCELVERVVPASSEDPALVGRPAFLEARGTRFPYSYPVEGGDWVIERPGWWCAECQRARAEWMQGRGG